MNAKATLFRSLHHGPKILVLPNAWDAASARLFEAAGFPAIATTSAGVANALGYADGQSITRDEMLRQVAVVVRSVNVPVTADVESGYDDPALTARLLWQIGAVGLNLEDQVSGTLLPVEEAAARIRSVREAAPAIVINARTDVYLFSDGPEETRFERTVERMVAYATAGADCIFVPGVAGEQLISHLVRAAGRPINILAVKGAPPVQRLQELGVARVSTGSGPMRATMRTVQKIAAELRDHGTYSAYTDDTISYQEANQLFLKD